MKELRLKNWSFEISTSPQCQVDIVELLEKQSVKTTLTYINDNQDAIYQQLINIVRADYDETFKLYGEDEEIPEVQNNDELLELLMPLHATIHETTKDGINYVGFGFDCSWQEEHGIGVLMYKDRVVQHGGEDHAFLEYMAEEDATSKT